MDQSWIQRTTMKKLIGISCLLLMGGSWQVGAFDERDLQELLETKDCEKNTKIDSRHLR